MSHVTCHVSAIPSGMFGTDDIVAAAIENSPIFSIRYCPYSIINKKFLLHSY